MDISPEAEAEYTAENFKQILQEVGPHLLPPNHPLVQYCQKIAGRIVTSAGLGVVVPGGTHQAHKQQNRGWGVVGVEEDESGLGNEMTDESQWEIFVIDDPKTPNAFVIPGACW
jgi:metalloendopeptidase OMA1, mitochondrial